MLEVINVVFHGAAFGMVLYVITVGLSITMGLMRFANLAHGMFAMVGGYALIVSMGRYGVPYPAALGLAFVASCLMGYVLERLLYSRFYGDSELAQVLISIGLIFVAIALVRMVFGPQSQRVDLPSYLQGQWHIFGLDWIAYRVFIIVVGALLILALWFGIERTRWGAKVRAAVDNRAMAQSIGIDTSRIFSLTFMLGSGLAGLGGALGVELLAVQPGYPFEFLVIFLMVVALGGIGSLRGTFFAALLIGLADTACKYWIPELGSFLLYGLVIVFLGLRPGGLFGAQT